jgi:hypothetical protein
VASGKGRDPRGARITRVRRARARAECAVARFKQAYASRCWPVKPFHPLIQRYWPALPIRQRIRVIKIKAPRYHLADSQELQQLTRAANDASEADTEIARSGRPPRYPSVLRQKFHASKQVLKRVERSPSNRGSTFSITIATSRTRNWLPNS